MFGQPSWKTYTNSRFGFSILYPADVLKPEPPPENGDGLAFLSRDKKAELRVWGDLNALAETVQARFETTLKEAPGKISYKVLRKDWFVVSGSGKGREFYKKVMFGKDGTVRTISLEYPVASKKRFDPLVERIVQSFKVLP
ncbi:hypothetical protein [Armatimonas sp.]|uniref:hypothetical protein n=1 Tax=Armatimonas sp. TaxID=1872638 RepID=UPI00286C045E|nr:hypothetical protein [Armatimonas sp.]